MARSAAVVRGWTSGQAGLLHRIGLAQGLRNPGTGLDYLVELLEPTLQAVEQRLKAHVAQGEMRPAETRHAALMPLSPLVLALLHQHDLGAPAAAPWMCSRSSRSTPGSSHGPTAPGATRSRAGRPRDERTVARGKSGAAPGTHALSLQP